MRVVSDSLSSAASAQLAKPPVAAKPPPPPSASIDEAKASGNATVTISTAALAKAAEPDVDHAKVALLKQAVDSGSYKIDSRQIAARLLEEE